MAFSIEGYTPKSCSLADLNNMGGGQSPLIKGHEFKVIFVDKNGSKEPDFYSQEWFDDKDDSRSGKYGAVKVIDLTLGNAESIIALSNFRSKTSHDKVINGFVDDISASALQIGKEILAKGENQVYKVNYKEITYEENGKKGLTYGKTLILKN